MLRCYIKNRNHIKVWFEAIKNKNFTTKKDIAKQIEISLRTLTDWQRAKYGIPKLLFEKLGKIVPYPYKDIVIRDDVELKRMAARLGGITTANKGVIGSIESRRKGGFASLSTHRLKNTGLFLLKDCQPFPHTNEVAELSGVIIGDGHLAQGQIEITLDARERVYAEYLQKLLQVVTGYTASIKNRTSTVIAIYLSGKLIVKEFHKLGIEYGNKTKKQNFIPEWVLKQKELSRAFIKGLFDTDGCLYIDEHIINNKTYYHWGISLTAYNQDFLSSLGKLLINLDFHPTTSTKHRIILRKQNEVHRFMNIISPANQKHIKLYPKMV